MSRPLLIPAINWLKYEQAVLAVFTEALRRLAERPKLPHGEEPINFELFKICNEVHLEFLKARTSIPFFILFDSTNQPLADDTVRSKRLKKRPDFACVLTDEQAQTSHKSRIIYSLECKRLGNAEAGWVLNENYSEYGIRRFIQADHSYAKDCDSAAMIGYMQNMEPDCVLVEVNSFSGARKIPSLAKAAAAWASQKVTRLNQKELTREWEASSLLLHHLWIDLRHCTFEKPPSNAVSAVPRAKAKRSASKRKNK
jgi:hypothetical protein